ncbi:hypothetical protein SLEP1_g5511 [Rubroshorea leprosula]|uniref:Uncharacterized protein n=1 Tax=Rubroshorea leprosula TaxID=152421 RepID=A0AAV5I2T1_9ROSI|nr:hypothetical protein SLEP1_g5511 [Rubroshorea leprosula]
MAMMRSCLTFPKVVAELLWSEMTCYFFAFLFEVPLGAFSSGGGGGGGGGPSTDGGRFR